MNDFEIYRRDLVVNRTNTWILGVWEREMSRMTPRCQPHTMGQTAVLTTEIHNTGGKLDHSFFLLAGRSRG